MVIQTPTKQSVRIRLFLGLGLTLSAVIIFGLAAAGVFIQSSNDSDARSGTSLSGIIEYVVVEHPQNHDDQVQAYLATEDDHIVLHLPEDLETPVTGTSVTLDGHTEDDGSFTVSSLSPSELVTVQDPRIESSASSLQVAGSRKVLVVMGYYPGTSVPSAPTLAETQDLVLGNSPSIADYYYEQSFGQLSVTGTVTGWIPFASPETYSLWSSATNALTAAKTANPGLDLRQFQHLIVISPYTATNLGDGFSVMGPTTVASPDGQLSLGVSIVRSTIYSLPRPAPLVPYVLVHEFGHQLGLGHGGALYCNTPGYVINSTCQVWEYGDHDDVMGGDYVRGVAQGLSSMHRDAMGWLSTSQMQTISASGDFTVEPLATDDPDVKVLKIARTATDTLYIDYRRPIGYDANLENPESFTGVQMHVRNTGYYNSGSVSTDEINITPNQQPYYHGNALLVGESFTDPMTGTVVTLVSQDANQAVVHVDYHGPVVYPDMQMTSPLFAHTYNNPVPFTSTVSHPSGISKVEYFLKDAAQPFGSSTVPPYSVSLDVSGYSNGTTLYGYMVATANDGTKASTAPIPFTLFLNNDVTAPSVTITAPAEGAFVTNPVLLQASISDAGGISTSRFATDCAAQKVAYCSFNYIGYPYVLYKTLSAGPHTIRVSADDYANHSTESSTIHFTVDNTSPILTSVLPANNATVSGVTSFSAIGTDDAGIDHYDLYFDGQLKKRFTTSVFSYDWDSRAVSEGLHSWYVIAYDRVGHSSFISSRSLTVRNGTATATITTPSVPTWSTSYSGLQSGAAVGRLSVNVIGDPARIGWAQFDVDGKKKAVRTVSPFTYSFDSAGYQNGGHKISVQIYPKSGVMVKKETTITFKNPLQLQLKVPANNATIRRTIAIDFAVRGGAGTSRVDYLMDGKRFVRRSASPFRISWDTKRVKNGWHTLTISVVDRQGKTATKSARVRIRN